VRAILKDGDLIVELESLGSVRVLRSTNRFQDEQAGLYVLKSTFYWGHATVMLSICSLETSEICCRQIRTTSVQYFYPDTPQLTINFTLTQQQARQTTKSEVISKTTIPGRIFVAQRAASSNRIQLPRMLDLPLRLCTSCTRSIPSCNSAPGALAGLFVEPSEYSGTVCSFVVCRG
jgi:hypothetical protein